MKNTIQEQQYFLNHQKIPFLFNKNSENFVVVEIPLYEFVGKGEHLIIKIRKKDFTTWDAIETLASYLGIGSREFGYAGLKDKDGMTIQYLSIHKKYEAKLDKFEHKKIKILEKTYHNNKIKIGHLKGNNFFIRLKKIDSVSANIINSVLKKITKFGIPNYFGYQRFGIERDNFELGRQVAEGEVHIKDKKKEKFLISAYQSYLFNQWLSKRIEFSKLCDTLTPTELNSIYNFGEDVFKEIKKQPHPFKIVEGDLMHHYPYGKMFYATDVMSEAEKFSLKDRVPTGLLTGSKTKEAEGLALEFEREFVEKIFANGTRRFAWIFPEDISGKYRDEENWYELSFTLPKGSYATVLLEELLHEKTDI